MWSFFQLLRDSPQRPRLLLLILASVFALGLGFIAFTTTEVKTWIVGGAYYYILGVFALFVFHLWKVLGARRPVLTGWLRRPGWVGVTLLAATGFALWADPFRHKILFDEYVLQATAHHMHATKEFGGVIRAYDIAGTWLTIDAFFDKRPYFFVFLVSLVHDFTGFRLANLFAVNVALTPVFFALVYWLGRELAGRGPALLAVGLLATLPLLAQNTTGAGMELHNLTMIVVVCILATLYLRAPDDDRLIALVFGAVLLAQSRYESVLFVVPTAIVIVLGWQRASRVLLPWPVVIAPLLLIPYAWHNRVLSASPLLWQLKAGQTSRFGLQYLRDNLDGAWTFFFNRSPSLSNSCYLSAVGGLALVWLGWCGLRRIRRSDARAPLTPVQITLLLFGTAVAGNLAMLMFYYWSRLDEIIASRFALPMCFVLALLAAWWVDALGPRRILALRLATIGLAVWLFAGALPAIARRQYTDENLVMQEVDWEHDILLREKGPLLLLTNKSTIPFVLWRIPTIPLAVAVHRGPQMAYHLREGTFKEVIVAQALRPTSAQGDRGVDPEDIVPDGFHLVPIAEKRFGGRWARLSRLVSIDEESPAQPAPLVSSP